MPDSDSDDMGPAPAPAPPPEMSSAPDAAPVAPRKKIIKKIIKRKKEPRYARPQVDGSFITSEPPPQTGQTFNIWYNKWAGGDREDKYLAQTHAKGRCNVARDSGLTEGDAQAGSYFCLFFARGVCPKGRDCQYLHRLPTLHDLFTPNVDCFGRDKFSDYRDDMGGVGTFMRQNRTIYVGRIHVTDDIEEVVARHFAEWGQVERARVLNSKGVAFVTYSNEANAQFAKEAMAHQSLDHDEVLNVRWATPDPNPMSIAREARRLEEQAAEAVRRALPAEFVAEIEGRDPEAKKRRRIEGSYGLDGYDAPDEVHYARGENAANPRGRGDVGGQQQQQLEQHQQQEEEEQQRQPEQQQQQSLGVAQLSAEQDGLGEGQGLGGIFSKDTLAQLAQARVAVTARPANGGTAAGPLVAYGSDDDDDDD